MKARRGITVVELLLGIAVVAGLVWWYIVRESEKKEAARIAVQEQQERDREQAERLAKQEAEKKAKEEARRAKEKAESERKLQERKIAQEENAKKQLEEKAKATINDVVEFSKMPVEQAFWSARYRVLMAKFEDAELGFISEAKSTEKPKGVTKRTNFWYVDIDYP